jgi:hypothetical protein
MRENKLGGRREGRKEVKNGLQGARNDQFNLPILWLQYHHSFQTTTPSCGAGSDLGQLLPLVC